MLDVRPALQFPFPAGRKGVDEMHCCIIYCDARCNVVKQDGIECVFCVSDSQLIALNERVQLHFIAFLLLDNNASTPALLCSVLIIAIYNSYTQHSAFNLISS